MDGGSGIASIVKVLFQETESLRLENAALRKMLREKRLTERRIQKEVAAYLRNPDFDETANRRWTTAVQRIEAILDAVDVSKALAAFQPRGKPQ
jgi:regulator of replication initiation timing